MDSSILVDIGSFLAGCGVGWYLPRPVNQPLPVNPPVQVEAKSKRPVHLPSNLPIVGLNQAVTVILMKDGVLTAHKRVESRDLTDPLPHPKPNPTELYTFSHLDERSSFIYKFDRVLEAPMMVEKV